MSPGVSTKFFFQSSTITSIENLNAGILSALIEVSTVLYWSNSANFSVTHCHMHTLYIYFIHILFTHVSIVVIWTDCWLEWGEKIWEVCEFESSRNHLDTSNACSGDDFFFFLNHVEKSLTSFSLILLSRKMQSLSFGILESFVVLKHSMQEMCLQGKHTFTPWSYSHFQSSFCFSLQF